MRVILHIITVAIIVFVLLQLTACGGQVSGYDASGRPIHAEPDGPTPRPWTEFTTDRGRYCVATQGGIYCDPPTPQVVR